MAPQNFTQPKPISEQPVPKESQTRQEPLPQRAKVLEPNRDGFSLYIQRISKGPEPQIDSTASVSIAQANEHLRELGIQICHSHQQQK